MAAEPISKPVTPPHPRRRQAPASEALARLERIQAELEQDIARLVREIAEQRDLDDGGAPV